MRKKRASNSREVLVMCGRAPFSICERYAWLRPRPSSRFIAATTSDWVMGRFRPRSEPSMMRRERSLSPRVMGWFLRVLRYAKCILQYVICQEESLYLLTITFSVCYPWKTGGDTKEPSSPAVLSTVAQAAMLSVYRRDFAQSVLGEGCRIAQRGKVLDIASEPFECGSSKTR